MLLTALLHLLFFSSTFSTFVKTIEIQAGFLMATSSAVCILVCAFFLSKTTKEQSIDLRHLDHTLSSGDFEEYKDILHSPKTHES
jgi:hypothetical protein